MSWPIFAFNFITLSHFLTLLVPLANRLQHKDVFDLIKKHNLYDVIKRTIVPLIQLDSDRAINMLLEKNKISPDVVVAQLTQKEGNEEYLYLVSWNGFTSNGTVS